MASFTSPYSDLTYSKGPKSLYYKEENVFEVVLNVPQQDDDDEWGRTVVIGQRQIIDRVTDIILEVEDPFSTQTNGLINQVTALLKALILDNAVYTSGTTSGVQLSIGSTSISQNSAILAGSLSVGSDTTIGGSLEVTGGLSVDGDITQTPGFYTAKFNVLKASWPTFCGNVTITEDTLGNGGSLSVQNNITAASSITGGSLSVNAAEVGILRVGWGAPSARIDGRVTICGNLTLDNNAGEAEELILNKTTTVSATDADATFKSVTTTSSITGGSLSVNAAIVGYNIGVAMQIRGAAYLCGDVNIIKGGGSSADLTVSEGTTTLKDLVVSDTLTASGNLNFDSATVNSNLTFSSSYGITMGTLNVTQSSNIGNNLIVGGNASIGGSVGVLGLLRACGSLTSDSYVEVQDGIKLSNRNTLLQGASQTVIYFVDNPTNKLFFVRYNAVGIAECTVSLDLSAANNDKEFTLA
jgi:predicted acyltransferase (DUF342 family)